MTDPKAVLHSYLKENREGLIWKLDGLSERDARLPRTATGNNFLGLIKHCLNVEAGYFGETFGREFPGRDELVPLTIYGDDPQADWYARADETKDGVLDLYRRVAEFADQTIDDLPLDTVGQVPWWAPGHQDAPLHRIIVHVTADLARHAGHADIMREQLDQSIGTWPTNDNLPPGFDWPGYVTKLTAIADRF